MAQNLAIFTIMRSGVSSRATLKNQVAAFGEVTALLEKLDPGPGLIGNRANSAP